MANLQPSRSWVPDAWSIKPTFSLTITFFQNLETELKNLKHSSHTIALSKAKGTISEKTNTDFL